jgi:membrane protein required for colicin V production
MNLLDGAILVCLVYNGFMGLRRGFFRLVVDILALVVSTITGLFYYPKLSSLLLSISHAFADYSTLISFGLIWFSVYWLIIFASKFLDNVLDRTIFLGPINRLLGLGLGMVKGLIFLLPLLIPLYFLQVPSLKHSLFSKPLSPILSALATQMKHKLPTLPLK